MTWPVPKPADIVWCYVPYEHPDGSTSLVRHPALVVAVDEAQAIVEVAVMGGPLTGKANGAASSAPAKRGICSLKPRPRG